MHPSRRRKKRPNYGIRTVEVMRGPNGFGFTISGQQPCILSCIVNNSPADQAGLRAGDFLISVNGASVSKITHDAVVGLIGNCVGPIKMTIAENYYSDSSDEELECGRMVNSRKPKYMHKPRARIHKGDLRRTAVETSEKNVMKMRECIAKQVTNEPRLNANVYNEESIDNPLNISNPMPMEDEAGPIEYKALVGYLGTIEMPKQLLPNSRLQTVCSCIRKLRQEKRTPTAVLMTILPTCLTLKNASNHILAIYPTNRVVYIGSTAERESRYFGLVTSAVCDTRSNESMQKRYGDNNWQQNEKKFNNVDNGVEISNSCHVFVTDPKITDHNVHLKKAESFKITCTADAVTGNCLEFPRNALYIVSLVQNMYKLQNNDSNRNNDLGPLVANSPQPSASSNSDSGIGFRDDCGNISDRILVVEFPMHRPIPVLNNNNRPQGIDGTHMPLEDLDLPLNNDQPPSFELNNIRCQNNLVLDRQNNLSKSDNNDKNMDMKQLNNLNNIRACEGVNIKNQLEPNECVPRDYLVKQNNDIELYSASDFNRLTCRAMPETSVKLTRGLSPTSVISSDDNTRNADVENGQIYTERAIDVPDNSPSKKSYECISIHSVTDDLDFKSSVDNVSMHSSKSIELSNIINVFKAPFESKKSKRQLKMGSSCDNLDKYNEHIMNYKLSPKVYGLSKPNYSCEELNNFDSVEKHGYGSLQDLYSWNEQSQTRRTIAQSEPDVRIPRNVGNNLMNMSSDSSSDEEFIYNALEYILRERQVLPRRHPFEIYSEEDFRIRYRFSKNAFRAILNILRPHLDRNSERGLPISAEDQLLIATRFYATGSFQKLIGDHLQVSTSSVCRIILKVSEQLAQLRPDIIDMPRHNEVRETKLQFFQIAHFPGVIGCIDCTHIPIQSPGGEDGARFRNRKGYFSINVQAVADARLRIRNIIARWPGSVHDSTIFNDSALKIELETGAFDEGFLLGDNGYGCKRYLLTPLLNPQTPAEVAYNRAHITTRNTVERMFGVWKRRFPCLSMGLRTEINKTLTIIIATAVLHNMAINFNDVDPLEEALQPEEIPVPAVADQDRNDSVRTMLINTYFNRYSHIIFCLLYMTHLLVLSVQ